MSCGYHWFLAASISSNAISVDFVCTSILLLYPVVRLFKGSASLMRFFSFSLDNRQLLTGRNVLISNHPNINKQKPYLYYFFAW